MTNEKRLTVFGLGYVGCVTAACMAATGHHVIGIDRDEFKIRAVNEGKAPFHEPGLEQLIVEGLASGRLGATVFLADALQRSDMAMVCVGTPSERAGHKKSLPTSYIPYSSVPSEGRLPRCAT